MDRPLGDLIGSSPQVEALRERVVRLLERQKDAHRLPSVLIEGETGTGKGLLARMLHRAGPRADGPFVDVNCAAIPETLLEAEMFGFERGAFTDARRAKPGLLQAAQRGTIFLDEVGLLSEALQAKLLKVLEERTVRRLGSTRDEPIDVWLITATNEDLRGAIRRRRFREDLYHRLAVVTLTLPPLRERGADIVQLADHFLRRACADYGIGTRRLSAEACAALLRYPWPGNVRELANLMERLALLDADGEITAAALGLPEARAAAAPVPVDTGASLDDAVRDRLVEVLQRTGWNISRTAALLGISRNTLRARIEKYGLRRDAPAAPPASREAPRPVAPAALAAPPPAAPAPAAPLRWERRRVTLLRAAVEFTGEGGDVLDAGRTLEALMEKVAGFGGRIEGLSPSGLLASFGLDLAEDAPTRAGHAAMAMQKAVERARAMGAAAPRFKAAIHVTEAMVARGPARQEIDVDTRHHALVALDALLALSAPEAIVVSEPAGPFLDRRFDLWEVDEPRRHFVLGGHVRTRLGVGGRVVAFVNHAQELDLLRSRFEAAARGQAQAVGVSGAAGVGKSRLLHEFRRLLGSEPAVHVEAYCVSHGRAVPYGPMIEVARAVARVKETDPPDVVEDKVRRSLEWARAPLDVADDLLRVLGVARPEGGEAHDPDALKPRVFDAVRRLCVRLSEEIPLVLTVEDVHWIDGTSGEFFTALVETMAAARMLLIATYRPGYRPPWIDKSYATQVPLPPLTPVDSRTLVRAIVGDADIADSLMESVFARAQGNPLFLEELARALREHGGIASGMAVPATIQELLLARIDRLPSEERGLLQTLAVIGRDIPLALVAALADEPAGVVAARLARLETAEFLHERAAGGDTEYSFAHALMQEVAYDSLLPEQRRALHERVFLAMARLYPERQADLVERLADHAFLGGLWDRAAVHLRQAGVKALSQSANREAADFLERALTALDRVPESRERTEQAIDLRFDLRTALLPLGEFARMTAHLREAERLAETLGDRRRLCQGMLYAAGHFRLRMGNAVQARRASTRALELAEALDDARLRVAATAYLGQALYDCGEYARAAELFARNVAFVGDNRRDRFGLPQPPSVHQRTTLAWCHAELGRFGEGADRAGEAIAIAEAVETPLTLAVACAGLGVVRYRQGDLDGARAVLERGLELIRTRQLSLWFPRIASTLGAVHVLAGRVDEGRRLLEEAIERAAAISLVSGQSLLLVGLADARLAAGDAAAAEAHARRGLDLAGAHGERGWSAWALRSLGDAAVAAGDVEAARVSYDECATVAAELAMRPLAALVQLGRGRLAARAGKAADARDLLAGAAAALRALDMPWWAARAEAAPASG